MEQKFTIEETEEEEAERLLREQQEEDDRVYSELGMYDGTYDLSTESEGAAGIVELRYNKDKTFDFIIRLTVPGTCDGEVIGQITMDRTQHGFYADKGCFLHFNFMGLWAEPGLIVEVEQEENCDKMKGECIFSGTYISREVEK